MPATYVLPLLRSDDDGLDEVGELTAYLSWLARRVEVVVVDASSADAFDDLHTRLDPEVRHHRPDPARDCLNGKVANVLTGLDLATHDRVVIADDDVRYDEASLTRMVDLLDDADAVCPQNVFDPMPWHAYWDASRTLLNRVAGWDPSGTIGVRRGLVTAVGGYDGDVLFENLELVRTVRAAGGTVREVPDLYVRRRPPTTARFLSQRVRQAYDELARPWRLLAFLAVLPGAAALLAAGRLGTIVAVAGAAVGAAEVGRRRAGGREVFPVAGSLLAPAWLLERGLCAWLAVGVAVLRGGCPYRGRVISRAANPVGRLRRRILTTPSG